MEDLKTNKKYKFYYKKKSLVIILLIPENIGGPSLLCITNGVS